MKEGSFNDGSEFPFNKWTKWVHVTGDMVRLSDKFHKWMFVVYSKSEYFVDNISVSVYRKGRLVHSSNDIECDIRLKLPNGTTRKLDKDGMVILDPQYSIIPYLDEDDRGFSEFMHIFTDVSVLVGKTIADLGSLAAEAAVAAKVLSVGLGIVDEMHQNLRIYNVNKGRFYDLAERCKMQIESLQKMPAEMLNIRYVIYVVEKIEEAKAVLDKYLSQWKITRFFSARTNKRMLVDADGNLSNAFHDFGVHFQVNKRIFEYTPKDDDSGDESNDSSDI